MNETIMASARVFGATRDDKIDFSMPEGFKPKKRPIPIAPKKKELPREIFFLTHMITTIKTNNKRIKAGI
jgi:hypothetical protein